MRLRAKPKVCLILLFVSTLIAVQFAQSQTFQVGDVFGSVGNSQVNWYHPDGTLVKTLITTPNTDSSGFTTGMAFDKAGNLYVTNFTKGKIAKLDNAGNFIGILPTAGLLAPESLVFDKAGNLYVGQAGSKDILKLDGSGNLLSVFSTTNVDNFGTDGTDWIELGADQHTLLFTSEAPVIQSFDTVNNLQNPPFASLVSQQSAFALRLLPSGNLLVAHGSTVDMIDPTGTTVRTYDLGGGNSGLFGLNLDPDGIHFWTSDFHNGEIFQVRIDTGAVEKTIATGAFGGLFGVAVFGEQTAGAGGVTTTAFAAFKASLELRPAHHEFELEGSFTLGKGNNGLNFAIDDLTMVIGTKTFTIPKGSLTATLSGAFTFSGVINKQEIEVSVHPSATIPGKFSIEFEGPGDPTGGANPAPVTLTIGDDAGPTKAPVTVRLD